MMVPQIELLKILNIKLKKLPRSKLIVHEKNYGQSYSLRTGILKSNMIILLLLMEMDKMTHLIF